MDRARRGHLPRALQHRAQRRREGRHPRVVQLDVRGHGADEQVHARSRAREEEDHHAHHAGDAQRGFTTSHLVAKDGTVHLGFAAHDDKAFLYGTFVKGVWSPGPTPAAQGLEFDSHFALALDTKNTPTALYDDGSRHLTWAHWQDGKAVTEAVSFEGAGRSSDYVLGADDVPHAVFTLNENQVAHAVRGASGWTLETVAKVASGAAVDATLAIAKDGALHVAWYEHAALCDARGKRDGVEGGDARWLEREAGRAAAEPRGRREGRRASLLPRARGEGGEVPEARKVKVTLAPAERADRTARAAHPSAHPSRCTETKSTDP